MEFDDVYSKSPIDLGRPHLLTMDTSDHPPITQRSYSPALKHVEWVQEEIEKLEQVCLHEQVLLSLYQRNQHQEKHHIGGCVLTVKWSTVQNL